MKYITWFRLNSHLIGGLQNWNAMRRGTQIRSVYEAFYKTDLEKFNKSHSVINPKVSLFNLAEDPEEEDNLAADFPDLVKELLAEAEERLAMLMAMTIATRMAMSSWGIRHIGFVFMLFV